MDDALKLVTNHWTQRQEFEDGIRNRNQRFVSGML